MTWFTLIDLGTRIAVVIVVPLSWLYLTERAKNLAREVSEKVLDDYRHQHAKDLELVKAAQARSNEEFSLYARERHRAYPRLYRRVRIAADAVAGLRGGMSLPDFYSYTKSDAERYLREENVADHIARPILDEYPHGQAGKLLRELYLRLQGARARNAIQRATNVEVLEELYLSDAVRAQMTTVRAAIVDYMLAIEHGTPTTGKPEAAKAAVDMLYEIMRSELSRPFEAKPALLLPDDAQRELTGDTTTPRITDAH